MNCIDRTKTAGILLAVIACIVFASGRASAQAAQGLAAVGAVDPANGYPKWYQDKNGLQLTACLDTTTPDPLLGGADLCGLVAGGAIPAGPVVFPTNFPDEFFYFLLNGRIDGIGGGTGRAILVNALEGAFGGPTGTAADGAGAQIVFARFRFRVTGGLIGGQTYEMQGPFGRRSFVAAADGTVNFTDDQGCLAAPPACPFNLPLVNTNVGPFLTWDPRVPPLAPAGFIGNPAIDHAITPGPGGNLFQIKGPNVGGPGVNVVSTNLFSLTGKKFVKAPTSTALASSPNPSTVGQAVTLTATVSAASGTPTGTVTFKDGAATIGTGTLSATGSAQVTGTFTTPGNHSLTAVYAGDGDFLGSTSAAVSQSVTPNAAPPPPPPPPAATDTVSIGLAQQVLNTGELRVEGVNSRIPGDGFAASDEIHDGVNTGATCPGALIATVAVSAADGKWQFRANVTARPNSVCVISAGGGVATRAVTQK